MKTKLKLASVLAALLLAACAAPLSAPVDEAAASGGAGQNGGHTVIFPADPTKGLALLSVSGAPAAARMVLPDLAGKTYSYRYVAEAEEEDPLSGDFTPGETLALELNPGLWTITVKAWEAGAPAEDTGDAENPPVPPAFVGRAELAVGAGETKSLTVGLLPNGEGSGTFSYAVTFTDGGQNFPANLGYALISLFPLDGGGAVDVIDLFKGTVPAANSTISGQRSLANGYYHITTTMNYKDGATQKFAAKREVLYIYEGLTSAYEVAFGTDDFWPLLGNVATERNQTFPSTKGIWYSTNSVQYLNNALAALPQNTPDTPYIIALTGYKLDGTDATANKRLGNAVDPLQDLFAVTQGRYVFYDLSGCTGTSIPSVANYVAGYLRQYRDRVTGIILPPSGLTTIGDFSFFSSISLLSINIPSTVVTIGQRAFATTGLSSIYIPSSVTSMGNFTFGGSPGLKTAVVAAPILAQQAFNNCTGLENVTLENTVTTISNQAFSGCSSLTSIDISAGVSTLAVDTLFNGCTSLKSITLRNTSMVTAPTNTNTLTGVPITAEDFHIYVPSSLVATYKSDSTWITRLGADYINNIIQPIPGA
jgi:hypothetical protein